MSINDNSYLIHRCQHNPEDQIVLHKTYSLNGTVATKFTFEVLLRGLVAKPCDDERLKSISTDIWIFRRFV
jgi:hypothetical protein